jgi:class 3 adenylate cyclase
MMRFFSIIMIGLIILFLLPLVVPYLKNANSFGYIQTGLSIDLTLENLLRKSIPTIVSGRDLTRWIGIFIFFLLSSTFSRSSEKFHSRAQYLKYKISMDQWKSQMHLNDNSGILSPLNQKLELIKNAKRKDREQLLKEFVETKKKLDEMGRDLAFLSIDVADSTGMKQGEERACIEHDFREYRRFVERALTTYGCLKSTWTPDGVMSAFTSVDAAVRAGREVIAGLGNFNKTIKTMRRDFIVRCGVNSGFVYFDPSMPLEDISDRVIDITAHIQKKARPNTVCVAKPAIEPLNERSGFEPAGMMVDGYEVYEWRNTHS